MGVFLSQLSDLELPRGVWLHYVNLEIITSLCSGLLSIKNRFQSTQHVRYLLLTLYPLLTAKLMYGFISQVMVLVLSTTIILTPLATALPTFLWFSLWASPSSPGWNLYLQDVLYLPNSECLSMLTASAERKCCHIPARQVNKEVISAENLSKPRTGH